MNGWCRRIYNNKSSTGYFKNFLIVGGVQGCVARLTRATQLGTKDSTMALTHQSNIPNLKPPIDNKDSADVALH